MSEIIIKIGSGTFSGDISVNNTSFNKNKYRNLLYIYINAESKT